MKKIKVAIRAGHGGADRSNVGPYDYVEADGNLMFALFLEEFLEKDNRFEVFNLRKRCDLGIIRRPYKSGLLEC